MKATQGSNLPELEARLVQIDLHLDEDIGMAAAAKSQGVRANLRLDDLNEETSVKPSNLIPIRALVTSISSAVEFTHATMSGSPMFRRKMAGGDGGRQRL